MRARAGTARRRLATVLFIDMVSSTERAASLGDRRWQEVLAGYRRTVRRSLRLAGGREVDNAGDGFFAVFDEPASALACACALTDDLHAAGVDIRSGIHVGEVETVGAKLSGIAVHIGARISASAGRGQVVISSTLRDVITGSDYQFDDLGLHSLKGVPGEWRLFSVTWTNAVRPHEPSRTRRRALLVGASGVAIAGAAAVIVVIAMHGSGPPPVQAAIVTVAGTGVSGVGAAGSSATATALAHPVALAIDSGGRLYIVDGDRILRLDPNGTLTAIAGTGRAGFSGDGGPATQAELDSPQAIAIDSAGDVFIADTQNNRVRRVDPRGVITTFAGTGQPGFGREGGPAGQALLSSPTGVAIGFSGTVLIADTGNDRVRVVAADGTIATFAGTGDPGYAGDGGPATSALLDAPTCLAVDANDDVYIADSHNNRVRRVDVDGKISTVAGTDDRRFGGDGGPATSAGIHLATGPLGGGGCLAADARGDLFIADALDNRVREVALDGTITTVAGNGRAGSGGENGPAVSAELDLPLGVTANSGGPIYVADAGSYRVRRVG